VIKSRRIRWAGHVASMGERRGTYRVLAGRPEGKTPFRTPRRRREDNIKKNLQEGGEEAGTGLIRFMIGTCGESL
jgi:hypothetical protein